MARLDEAFQAAAPQPDGELGLAPGGLMRQEICEDPYGFDAWDGSVRSRCFVHILNSVQFLGVTGSAPLQEPPSAQQYSEAGLPWSTTTPLTWKPWQAPRGSQAWTAWQRRASRWGMGLSPATVR